MFGACMAHLLVLLCSGHDGQADRPHLGRQINQRMRQARPGYTLHFPRFATSLIDVDEPTVGQGPGVHISHIGLVQLDGGVLMPTILQALPFDIAHAEDAFEIMCQVLKLGRVFCGVF